MSEYIVFSKITGKTYNIFNAIRIKNFKQAGTYMLNGIYPVDVEVERNENGDPKIIWIFDKDNTKEVYDKWCKYELK